jgi:Protein of unknown function (DUF2782)
MSIVRSLLRLMAVLALAVAGAVLAQNTAPSPPLQPPPPKPESIPMPPPSGIASGADLEPQVTIKRRAGDTVEEARIGGRLAWIKVTPRYGRPYFLIPDSSGNIVIRRDNLDTGLRVPLWVLREF